MKKFDEWLPLNFNIVVIRGNNKIVLVNTGLSKNMFPIINKLWVEEIFKSKDARLNVSEEEHIENALATLDIKPENIDYVKVLLDIGEIEPKTVLLGADSLGSAGGQLFRDKFPERTFNFGIAEPNMLGAAAGFAMLGKIPQFLLCIVL